MCDIDRELVLRGAAYFATFAAEKIPVAIDPFTAKLIEQALRAKLKNGTPPKNGASNGHSPRAPVTDAGQEQAARDALLKMGHSQRVGDQQVKLLVAFRLEPERVFRAKELGAIGGYSNPSHSGGLHAALARMTREKFITKRGFGSYQLAPKGRA